MTLSSSLSSLIEFERRWTRCNLKIPGSSRGPGLSTPYRWFRCMWTPRCSLPAPQLCWNLEHFDLVFVGPLPETYMYRWHKKNYVPSLLLRDLKRNLRNLTVSKWDKWLRWLLAWIWIWICNCNQNNNWSMLYIKMLPILINIGVIGGHFNIY